VERPPEETEEEKLLAAGHLFRIKEIAEQVILDEFANMLLPPPPLTSVTTGSRPGTEESASSPTGARRRRQRLQQCPTSAAFSSGVQSTLAADFRKVIEDAYRLIELPDEAKQKKVDTDDVEAFLKDLDKADEAGKAEFEELVSRSSTVSTFKTNIKCENKALETHLRMRAERHTRRLQSRGHKAVRGHGHEDLWPRRLQGCRRSLGSIHALDAFAEMRARQKLATA
jgi:hypothetical protein